MICSTDDGLVSIREYDIPVEICKQWDEVKAFLDWCCTPDCKHSTIILDDLSETCDIFIINEKPLHKNPLQAYGVLADEILAMIRKLRQVPDKNFVLLCKEERMQDDIGRMMYRPMVAGKAVPLVLSYIVGEVYRMEHYTDPKTSQAFPVLRTKGTFDKQAGSRSGRLDELESANLATIFEKIKA